MKSLHEQLISGLRPIFKSALNEISDSMLQRAYDEGMSRCSGLEKRRAKKFLEWKNSPIRQEIIRRQNNHPRNKVELFNAIRYEIENNENPSILDLNYIDTSAITDMSGLFSKMTFLTEVHIEDWDVSNVIDMSGMFYNCKNLTYLDLNDWNVSEVVDMNFMFYRCHNLETVGINFWNTVSVEDMSGMFGFCTSLEYIDMADLNVISVEDMLYMFYNCSSLKQLEIPDWNTRNVRNMNDMFAECESLESFNCSNWDISRLRTTSRMFQNCENLEFVNMSGWFLMEHVYDMSEMFFNDRHITKVKVLNKTIHIGELTDTTDIFAYCARLNPEGITLERSASKVAPDEEPEQVPAVPVETKDGEIIGDDGQVYVTNPDMGTHLSNSTGSDFINSERLHHGKDINLFLTPEEVLEKYGNNPKFVKAIYLVITKQRQHSEYAPVLYYYDPGDIKTKKHSQYFLTARNAYIAYLKSLEDFDIILDCFKDDLEKAGLKYEGLEPRVSSSAAFKKLSTVIKKKRGRNAAK